MADTTALDLARYINLADNNTTVTGVQNYLNLKLANVDTRQRSNARLAVTAGLWSGGAFTPVLRVRMLRRRIRWNRRATQYRSPPGSPCPRSSTEDSGF